MRAGVWARAQIIDDDDDATQTPQKERGDNSRARARLTSAWPARVGVQSIIERVSGKTATFLFALARARARVYHSHKYNRFRWHYQRCCCGAGSIIDAVNYLWPQVRAHAIAQKRARAHDDSANDRRTSPARATGALARSLCGDHARAKPTN